MLWRACDEKSLLPRSLPALRTRDESWADFRRAVQRVQRQSGSGGEEEAPIEVVQAHAEAVDRSEPVLVLVGLTTECCGCQ